MTKMVITKQTQQAIQDIVQLHIAEAVASYLSDAFLSDAPHNTTQHRQFSAEQATVRILDTLDIKAENS